MPIRFIIALVVLLIPLSSQAIERGGIVAVVGEEIITSIELGQRIDFLIATTSLPDNAETRKKMLRDVLLLLIDESIQRQESKRLGLEVTERDMDNAFRQLADRNNTTPEEFKASLLEKGISNDVFNKQIRNQVLWQKVIGRAVRPLVNISELEVREARARFSDTGSGEVRLKRVSIPATDIKAAESSAETLRALLDCAPGQSLESSFTVPNTTFADLGLIESKNLTPQIRAKLRDQQVGVAGAPLKVGDNLDIYLVCERLNIPGNEVTDERIKELLLQERLQLEGRKYMIGLRNRTFVDIRL